MTSTNIINSHIKVNTRFRGTILIFIFGYFLGACSLVWGIISLNLLYTLTFFIGSIFMSVYIYLIIQLVSFEKKIVVSKIRIKIILIIFFLTGWLHIVLSLVVGIIAVSITNTLQTHQIMVINGYMGFGVCSSNCAIAGNTLGFIAKYWKKMFGSKAVVQ